MHPGTTVAPLPLSPHFTESLAREFYKALGEEEEEEEEEEGSNLPSPLRCALAGGGGGAYKQLQGELPCQRVMVPKQVADTELPCIETV